MVELKLEIEDLRRYRRLFLDVEEKKAGVLLAQAELKSAENALNRLHEALEGQYDYWIGRDEVDMKTGTVTLKGHEAAPEVPSE